MLQSIASKWMNKATTTFSLKSLSVCLSSYTGSYLDRHEEKPKYMVDPTRSVFVRNLPYSSGQEDLDVLMKNAGDVSHSILMRRTGGSSKGQAIVEFFSSEAATKAIETFDGVEHNGRTLFVSMFQKLNHQERNYPEPKNTVFIANLPPTQSNDTNALNELFRSAGISAPLGKTFAFADFESKEEAYDAIAQLNGIEYMGNNIVLRYSDKN